MLLVPVLLAGGLGGDAEALSDLPEGAYHLPDGALAIPLRADTPPSYTPEVHAKVLAAAEKGMGYDVVEDVEVPLAAMNLLFIRPGAWMWSPSWCTMNFIYGSPGAYQIGTAGHCAGTGQDVTLLIGNPGVLVNVGKVASSANGGIGNDWALVSIRSNMQQYVDPNVAEILGPQGGAWNAPLHFPWYQPVKHFGHGLGMGTGGTPRAGVVVAADASAFYMNTASINGDSGAPVLTNLVTNYPALGGTQYPLGQAVGVLTHLVVTGPGMSLVAGTRMAVVPATVVDGDVNPLP